MPLHRLPLAFLLSFATAQVPTFTPLQIPINSGRPTFPSTLTRLPGKIALEEHVGSSFLAGTFTTPFVNFTNEVNFDIPIYKDDVLPRLMDIDSRIAAMDAANISLSVVMFGAPGIQGVFNKTLATEAAAAANDEIARVYKHGNYSSRFEFWCSNALQEPDVAAKELERCVKTLGGVGSFVGGYTNNGSADSVVYLDDPSMRPFLDVIVKLDVPIYLHPRTPPPSQQRVYQGYEFLAGSPWGFSSETAAHVLRLMVSGLFDEYPTLKIILGHCGEGLPFFMPRIDQRMRHFSPYWGAKEKMQTYWERNFWVTTSGVQDWRTLEATLGSLGGREGDV